MPGFFFVLYAPKFAHHPLGKTKETRQGNCQINPIPEWLGENKRTFPVTTIASDFLSFSHGPSFVSFGFFSWKLQIIIIIHFFLLLLLRIMLAPSVAAFNSAVVTARLFSWWLQVITQRSHQGRTWFLFRYCPRSRRNGIESNETELDPVIIHVWISQSACRGGEGGGENNPHKHTTSAC